MRIGIDYVPAATHAPGAGRYARELVRALLELEHGPELRLFDARLRRARLPRAALGLDAPRAAGRAVRRVRLPLTTRLARVAGRAGWTADRLLGGVDLFHRVRPTDPPVAPSCPTTVAVAELPPAGSAAEARARDVLAAATALLCFSRDYERRLRELGFPADAIHRVPVGADHWRRDLAGRGEAPELVPGRIVVLGAVRLAREPERLAGALEALHADGVPFTLEWLGRQPTGAEAVRERFAGPALRGACRFRPAPSEPELARAVARAAVLVHLSPGEGTAVTPLEALGLGTAVVATRLPAFEECLGDLGLWAPEAAGDPDGRGLAEVLREGLERGRAPARREEHRERGAPYTWAETARATAAAWESVLSTDGT